MKVMVNGLPGKMATKVVEHVIKADDMELILSSLTGPDMGIITTIGDVLINLISPEQREQVIQELKEEYWPFISIDFVKDPNNPNLPNDQADFYCRHGLPFVMGSVGGDRDALEKRVQDSDIVAVIAPNMAKQIVALQALMEKFAGEYANRLGEYELSITESHQKSKGKETSGTAKAMVNYFNALGINFEVYQIEKIRDPEKQLALGVPSRYLNGHGWHTYKLSPGPEADVQAAKKLSDRLFEFLSDSPVFGDYERNETKTDCARALDRRSKDETVFFKVVWDNKGNMTIRHNVNGRDIYAIGALDAERFLQRKIEAGEKGEVYSMIDVLEGN